MAKDAKGHGSDAHSSGITDASRAAAYNIAKAAQARLQAETARTGAITNSFPRLPNGLTPDEVKFTPEYQAARKASSTAFQNERNFNSVYVKQFAKEIKADRMARNAARTK